MSPERSRKCKAFALLVMLTVSEGRRVQSGILINDPPADGSALDADDGVAKGAHNRPKQAHHSATSPKVMATNGGQTGVAKGVASSLAEVSRSLEREAVVRSRFFPAHRPSNRRPFTSEKWRPSGRPEKPPIAYVPSAADGEPIVPAPTARVARPKAPVAGAPLPPAEAWPSSFEPAARAAAGILSLGLVAAAARPVTTLSHFSTIKTQFKDGKVLAEALEDLGQNVSVCEDEPVEVRGYRGDTQKAEIVVTQPNGYDIGFKRNENQVFEMVTDLSFWNQAMPADLFLERLSQQYGVKKVLELADEQNFIVQKQEVTESGAIKIKLNRYETVGAS